MAHRFSTGPGTAVRERVISGPSAWLEWSALMVDDGPDA
jgi:hypothetical protein